MRAGLILFLLVILLASVAASQAETTIPLRTNGARVLITIKIGGVVIPDLLLDTGFAYDGVIIYNTRYLDSLDLSRAVDAQIGGAGSGAASKAAMIDSGCFRVGDAELTNQRIILLRSDTYKGFPSNGVIGYSILGHYVTEINRDLGVIKLYLPGEAPIDTTWIPIPLYFKQNKIPWADVSVAIRDEPPTTLSTYIDFAENDAVVLLDGPHMKVGLPDDTVSVYLGRGLSGDVYGKAGTISKLIIGPYELAKVKASIAPAEIRSRQPGADAVLGSGALARFNLIFDYPDSKLYIKPAGHFSQPSN
ncbi:MAG TPA: hypothetical protein VMU02_06570 [bacterium]|nr:hypothetical protein [bacterium]